MRKLKPTGRFIVTGPGIETRAQSRGEAFSYAQTVACRSKEPVTLYVRDVLNHPIGRVERLEGGTVLTYGGTATTACAA